MSEKPRPLILYVLAAFAAIGFIAAVVVIIAANRPDSSPLNSSACSPGTGGCFAAVAFRPYV